MDSKCIYIACTQQLNKISWEKQTNHNEWLYVGDYRCLEEQKIISIIEKIFEENKIYFVLDKNNSFEIERNKTCLYLKKHMIDKNVILSNKNFDKMILFRYMGSAKFGKKII